MRESDERDLEEWRATRGRERGGEGNICIPIIFSRFIQTQTHLHICVCIEAREAASENESGERDSTREVKLN